MSTIPDRHDFSADLRISHYWLFGLLLLVSIAFFQIGDAVPRLPKHIHIDHLGLLLFAAFTIVMLVNAWRPYMARWLVLPLMILMIVAGAQWLDIPSAWTMLAFPVMLAAALISLTAAGIVAFLASLMLMLINSALSEVESAAVIVALLLIWGSFGTMIAVYRPIYDFIDWVWEYYHRAHYLVEEARLSKMELAQVLEDLKRANVQLTRMNLLAQGLRHAAEQAHTAKAEFVANVSHELRTPLNMITGFSETILDSPDIYGQPIPAALLDDLAVIHRNAEHLAHLIDDVLDLSQIDADQMALTREHHHVKHVIEEAVVVVRPLYQSRGLRLDVIVADDLPTLYCDRTRIREVLLNLLSNAGRYTEQGGVRLEAVNDNKKITISVSDTGPGIARENLSKLFNPFSQVDGSIRRRYGGTGLGLAISKRFVELHGGRIWVDSTPGQGTTVSFELPIDTEMPAWESWRQMVPGWEFIGRQEPSRAPRVAHRPRFVVVESGSALRRLLERYWDGVEVTQVRHLQEACDELAREPAQALLINDLSVSDALRDSAATPLPGDGTPVIICSLPEATNATTSPNAEVRLVKPIAKDQLLNALERLGVLEGSVLIVDDEPDALHLFGRILATSDRSYQVLLARDGHEALEVLADAKPDAVLLDLVMPNMDGFEVLKYCRQNPEFSNMPVVIISAQDPSGQPIVSSALAVTRQKGLSVSQLLAGIEALSRHLSPANQLDGSTPIKTSSD